MAARLKILEGSECTTDTSLTSPLGETMKARSTAPSTPFRAASSGYSGAMRLMSSGSLVRPAGLLESSTVLPVKVAGASGTDVPGLARIGLAGAGTLVADGPAAIRGGGLLTLGTVAVCLENHRAGPEGGVADSASCFARSASKKGRRGWVGAICCRAAMSVRAAL